jgi:hypothetical protein
MSSDHTILVVLCDHTHHIGVITKANLVCNKLLWYEQVILGVNKRPFFGNCVITPYGVITRGLAYGAWPGDLQKKTLYTHRPRAAWAARDHSGWGTTGGSGLSHGL